MMWAKGDGIPVDEGALAERVASAVHEVAGRQIDAGVDIVNDGEMSKPSYATYVKDRLDGFGGEAVERYYFADLADYPRSAEIVAANPGRRKRTAPACTSEIAVRDREAIVVDMTTLGEAVAGKGVAGTFTSAASPGVVSLFFENQFYDSDEEYLFAIAEAMRFEYEAIAAGGATVQLDCPDLAMGRHTAYAAMDMDAFRRRAALNIEALNHAVRNIPVEQLRMHLCWGNYPGPHHHDVDLAAIIDLVWTAKPRPCCSRRPTPATRTSGRCSRTPRYRRTRCSARGDRAPVQLRRAPRAGRPADRAVRRPRRPRPGHGGRRLRLQRARRHPGHRSGRHLGQAPVAGRGRGAGVPAGLIRPAVARPARRRGCVDQLVAGTSSRWAWVPSGYRITRLLTRVASPRPNSARGSSDER
jgi:methionine synthase II (cobalamin-independent)